MELIDALRKLAQLYPRKFDVGVWAGKAPCLTFPGGKKRLSEITQDDIDKICTDIGYEYDVVKAIKDSKSPATNSWIAYYWPFLKPGFNLPPTGKFGTKIEAAKAALIEIAKILPQGGTDAAEVDADHGI